MSNTPEQIKAQMASKQKLKKQIHLLVEHAMLQYPGSTIVKDCPECNHRHIFVVENIDSVERMTRLIEEIMEASDYNRAAVWQAIGEYTAAQRLEEDES